MSEVAKVCLATWNVSIAHALSSLRLTLSYRSAKVGEYRGFVALLAHIINVYCYFITLQLLDIEVNMNGQRTVRQFFARYIHWS